MRFWSTVQWNSHGVSKYTGDSDVCQETQGTVVSHNAVFEPPHGNGEGNEVQTTTEKVKQGGGKMEGSDRGTGTGMDMNFVFKYMCLITYVSLLLGVIDCADTE